MKNIPTTQQHAENIRKLEEKWKYRKIPLPTEDKMVMLRLRELGEPIMLFGEEFESRRERLRDALAKVGSDQGFPQCALTEEKTDQLITKLHYTDGGEELIGIRRWLLVDSLLRAKSRTKEEVHYVQHKYESIHNVGSMIGDEYRVLRCKVGRKSVITGGADGKVRVWDLSDCSKIRETSVEGQIYSLNFSPIEEAPIDFVVGTSQGYVKLFAKNEEQPLGIQSHTDRVNAVEFHQSGRFLLTGSHDSMIKLWDLENGGCVLKQTGHSGSVRCIGWQRDGGIFASGGNDRIVHLFDVRNGKQIGKYEGHASTITSLDWHCNGGVLVTASDDNTVKLWDIRMERCGYTIPAHSTIVTAVKLSHQGDLLLTSSFDHSIKLWSLKNWNWKLVCKYEEHSKPVVDVDWLEDDEGFISCGFDKTWKIYKTED
ncbi:hypothetical protein ENUP19_0041G0001 [Entamoeba nuttalli]|uniref:WD domain, G-beta repeat-containing protein n=2 Tax=Entamoeba nuttalli TaxID=412467 RepID=K2GX36_ENTNP|nr:WD domain, G-beta repeat-containing protein [Entamoeba nuttalli P19]EKE39768.1 WD domain, G-beta repeat-containing protein [Entamoeba nuttalli P19]|eukprot:XP_008857895.1 WD domain, G-beta repeat-containing protein [Entamoeba nuttalli P19]